MKDLSWRPRLKARRNCCNVISRGNLESQLSVSTPKSNRQTIDLSSEIIVDTLICGWSFHKKRLHGDVQPLILIRRNGVCSSELRGATASEAQCHQRADSQQAQAGGLRHERADNTINFAVELVARSIDIEEPWSAPASSESLDPIAFLVRRVLHKDTRLSSSSSRNSLAVMHA